MDLFLANSEVQIACQKSLTEKNKEVSKAEFRRQMKIRKPAGNFFAHLWIAPQWADLFTRPHADLMLRL